MSLLESLAAPALAALGAFLLALVPLFFRMERRERLIGLVSARRAGGKAASAASALREYARRAVWYGAFPSEAWFWAAALAAVLSGAWLASWAVLSLLGAPAGAAGGALAVRARVERARVRRELLLTGQLPLALSLMVANLRSNPSLPHAFAAAGAKVDPPLGPRLLVCARELEHGKPPREVVEDLERWLELPEGRAFTLATSVVGGAAQAKLVSTYEVLAETVSARAQARLELLAAVAEHMLSAQVLTAVWLGVYLLQRIFAPEYGAVLATTTAGRAVSVVGAALVAAGWIAIARMTKVGD